jgi:3-oxoacyl-[acyl-carrier protein] reductase
MDLNLSGKTALITGASKGIGRAAALALAAEGCGLVLVSRTASALDEVRGEIARVAPKVHVMISALDVSDSKNVQKLAQDHSTANIIVNNAGAIPGGNLLEIDEARWRAAWELKVFGYINVCRAFYGLMRGWKSGVIINVIGTAAVNHDPEYICGVTGNAALAAFTQSLGSVSARDGVRVVGIHPGPTSTDRLVGLMKKKAQDRTGDPETWRDLTKPLPFGRAATPEEIGAAIAFLASEKSGYTSGTILTLDGGASARAYSF